MWIYLEKICSHFIDVWSRSGHGFIPETELQEELISPWNQHFCPLFAKLEIRLKGDKNVFNKIYYTVILLCSIEKGNSGMLIRNSNQCKLHFKYQFFHSVQEGWRLRNSSQSTLSLFSFFRHSVKAGYPPLYRHRCTATNRAADVTAALWEDWSHPHRKQTQSNALWSLLPVTE